LIEVEKVYAGRARKSNKQLRHELIDKLAIHEFPFPELAPEAIALALGALLLSSEDFEATLLFAVNLGRDTDTIAAICGAVMGAKVGFCSVPSRWANKLQPATGSCLKFAEGTDLVSLAPALIELRRTL
jgi:ADP-ribosylglycohydrolase